MTDYEIREALRQQREQMERLIAAVTDSVGWVLVVLVVLFGLWLVLR